MFFPPSASISSLDICGWEKERRSRYLALPWYQNFWISTNRGHVNMGKKGEKIHMYDFPVHDCTQEQNG